MAGAVCRPATGRPLRRYAFITLVDSVGSGLFITISVLFFTRVIEFSIALGVLFLGLAFALAKASTWAQSRLTASSATEAEVP